MALADRVLALEPEGPAADAAVELVEKLGSGPGRLPWIIGAIVVLGLVAVVVMTTGLWAEDTGGAQAAHDAGFVPGDGAAAPMDARAETPVMPDAAPPIDSPVPIPTRADAQQRSVRPRWRRADAAPMKASERPDATPTRSADATPPRVPIDAARSAPAAAEITLDIRPWCDLRIDGKDHGRAVRSRVISLPPGPHELVCSQGPGRAAWTKSITLKSGQRLDLDGRVHQPVRVSIEVESGDRVRLAGVVYKKGAALSLTPGRYRVDLYSGRKKLAGGWISIPSVRACTIREKPALDCYP
ncbi:MAG: hypothetical protein GY778_32055 [bacterium]|nr:hypothetical protein [bacterium]